MYLFMWNKFHCILYLSQTTPGLNPVLRQSLPSLSEELFATSSGAMLEVMEWKQWSPESPDKSSLFGLKTDAYRQYDWNNISLMKGTVPEDTNNSTGETGELFTKRRGYVWALVHLFLWFLGGLMELYSGWTSNINFLKSGHFSHSE